MQNMSYDSIDIGNYVGDAYDIIQSFARRLNDSPLRFSSSFSFSFSLALLFFCIDQTTTKKKKNLYVFVFVLSFVRSFYLYPKCIST